MTAEPNSYLGYPLTISKKEIVVFTPTGRRVCKAASVKQARLLIRAYRREERSSRVRVVGYRAERALPAYDPVKVTC